MATSLRRSQRYRLLGAFGAVALAATTFAAAGPAAADTVVDTPQGPVSVEYVAPDVDQSSTIVVSPDTETSGGSQEAAREEACGPYQAWAPIGGGWSSEQSWVDCTYVGGSSTSTKSYYWDKDPNAAYGICAQGFGYIGGITPYWAGAGCGSSGGGTVDWGNVWGTPKYKSAAQGPFGVFSYWT